MSSPPTTLGKYQIIREIARSNDIVYEAYDPLMNRRVAVKELAVPGGSTTQQKDDRLKRFLREAKAAGSLAHPNIVTIFEVGEDGGRHYLVMEYLDGHTLRNELDTHGFLTPDHSLEIAESILRGLEYAHQNGVIHRDIKPENIQILSDGRIKLTDFGIARLTFEPNLTMDGQVFGTPSYMSPEQVVGRDIDARSDLFSVGVVLYEMLGGQKPFPGDSVVAITYAIMNKEPDQPPQANHAVWRLISKALDKSPGLRYSSSTEMIAALQSARHASSNVVMDNYGTTQSSQASPFLPPAPPFQTQTNPYLPQPPTNPYLQQPPQQQQYSNIPQPPIQYAYNPYGPYGPPGQQMPQLQQQQPISMPYNPGQPNVPMNVPYYPPPPRRPVMSPEQRQFWGTTAVVFLIVGTICLLVVVVLMYYGGELGTRNSRNSLPRFEPNTVSQPVGDVGTESQGGSPNQAEQSGLKWMDQAKAVDPSAAMPDWDNAIQQFRQAESGYESGNDDQDLQRAKNEEATAHLGKASVLAETDHAAARQELYLGRDEAERGSPIYDTIQTSIENLS
jgi:serine/threonine-protein kinase